MPVINRIQTFLSKNALLIGPLVLMVTLLTVGVLGKGFIVDVAMLFEATVEEYGALGYFFFICIFFLAALCGVFPLSLLAVLGGMAYGLLYGFALGVIGIFTGAAAAFLLGRYALRSTVEWWLTERVALSKLDSEIGANGWKIVGLLRLSPFTPFSIASYAFSMTKISFGAYMVGTIGAVPSLFAFVYTGSISAVALNALLLGQTKLNDVQVTVFGVGFIATVVVAFLFVRIARRALTDHSLN